MMHIITGSARGVRLDTLPGEATRPTSERAKEAIFSMLQFDLEGRRVLDLFAGSGQMGLEALSRGAAHAVLAVYEGRQVHILDNLVEHVRPMRRVRNYEPYFSVNENGRWMHVKAKPSGEGKATENGHGTDR